MSLAVVTIHGIGVYTDEDGKHKKFDNKLIKNIEKNLEKHYDSIPRLREPEDFGYWRVNYDDVLHPHQLSLLKRVNKIYKTTGVLKELREFALFALGDAATLGQDKSDDNSIYFKVQQRVKDVLIQVGARHGFDTDLIFVAQSMGAHVISSYIWDAHDAWYRGKKNGPTSGIWKGVPPRASDLEDQFLRCRTLKALFTTGTNIPVFLSAIPKKKIKSISAPSSDFVWYNYFDKDDMLGWPLSVLSKDYEKLASDEILFDREINVGGLLRGWSPLSNTQYWSDRRIGKEIANSIFMHWPTARD